MITRSRSRPEACPSDFAFDRQMAGELGGDDKAAFEAHVASCERCTRRLAGLSEDKEIFRRDAPTLLLRGKSSRSRAMPWPWLAGAVAMAAGVILFARGREMATGDYVGVKGTPGVQLLVHREEETHIWDGRSPVHPGDSLALRIACEGLSHVVVAAPGGAPGSQGARWQRLSEGACPQKEDLLPFTLVVDNQPGDERLAIVLSQEELDDGRLGKAIAASERTRDVWVVSFLLAKETGTRR
jgi:hypothetical protein